MEHRARRCDEANTGPYRNKIDLWLASYSIEVIDKWRFVLLRFEALYAVSAWWGKAFLEESPLPGGHHRERS